MSMKSISNWKLHLGLLLLFVTTVVLVFVDDLGIRSIDIVSTEHSGESKVFTRLKYESNLEIKRDTADIQVATSITNESLYTFGSVNPSAVYLRLKGGLGNQLFQYACHYGIARKNNWPLYTFVSFNVSKSKRKFNVWERDFALDYFNIPLYKWNMVDESWNISDKIEYINDSTILSGLYSRDKVISQGGGDYCVSEAFFSPYKTEIRQMFTYRNVPTREAMERISSMLDHPPTFFIFTDDVDYAKQEFLSNVQEVNSGTIYVVSLSKLSSLQDFYLMSKCNHNIIPNSSFGWWAAYLNSNPKKIVIAAHQQNKLFDFMFPGPDAATVRDFNKFMYRHLYYPYDWITIDPFV